MNRPAGPITRRKLIKGLAAAGACAGLELWRWPAIAWSAGPVEPAILSGNHFELEVGPLAADIGGKTSTGVAVNGSIPGPLLKWREGDTVTIAVTNHLRETTSIHWHGIRLPSDMDGVPGLSFAGIAPGTTFTYRFPVRQSGTYWYHSHSHFQEQIGLHGPLIVEPRGRDPIECDRDYVIFLSDWPDQDPDTIASNLKQQSDYYNYHQQTLGGLVDEARAHGLGAAVANRLRWGWMNMSPTDISDVSGATYTYLVNGQPPALNWTALFAPGERVRLRFINGSSMTYFDVRIPNLPMTVVQSDGNDVEPVTVDEFRIAVAETYDVIVQPRNFSAYTIFAQAEDRSGYARATLAPRAGMTAAVPPMDPRPRRTMADMGMANMSGSSMPGMKMGDGSAPSAPMKMEDHAGMSGMSGMSGQPAEQPALTPSNPVRLHLGPEVASIAAHPVSRLNEAGDGLDGNGRRVLTYADLRARVRGTDPRPPSREIELHLTGNMQRFIWGFNGKKFSEAEPIRMRLGERVRIVLINDTMMEHPIHLHGLWSELENGDGEFRPYKHTINVKPGERLSYLVSADTPGHWAYHCHLLYHMEMGMFRTVIVE
ncbi:MAG TPA: copper resistance system multicopper oxidase [Candidatus Binataceae bacterium]|nr:copper resistance system multicopper oxidase [Candidatus Binataceae bacterium]